MEALLRFSSRTLFVMALALLAPAGVRASAGHRVRIEIRGPLAFVEVTRSLEDAAATQERALDVDLPDGAVLLGVELLGGSRPVALLPTAGADGLRRYDEALKRRDIHILAIRSRPEEGADHRVRVATASPRMLQVRYRFVAPLGCARGSFTLRMPGALEVDPRAAEATVSFLDAKPVRLEVAGLPVKRSCPLGTPCVRTRAPARAAWEVSFGIRSAPGALPAQVLAARAGATLALAVCRGEPDRAPTAPAGLLLAIDRSRSMGPAGISLAREVALALLEALPPSLRFNVVLFDRKAAALFPLAREATREAMAALSDALTPANLQNGTEVGPALRLLDELMERAGPSGDARFWRVILTDGSLPEEVALDLRDGAAAAGGPIGVLVVRPPADEPPGASSLALLGRVPSLAGGILRVVDPARIVEEVSSAAAALGRGGDLFEVSVGGVLFALVVPPQAGAFTVRRLSAPARQPMLRARYHGGSMVRPLSTARVPPAALQALERGASEAWVADSPGLSALVERAGPAVSHSDVPRGELDRQVLRNALSLAFLPRARACYLNRRAPRAADRELRGRLRLELHIDRGEVHAARVGASTLDRPEIERCLEEAAFAVEIPRPMHRDAPTLARVNLIFQPRTAAADAGDAASPLSRELDLLLGPLSFPEDPLMLLEATPAPARGHP